MSQIHYDPCFVFNEKNRWFQLKDFQNLHTKGNYYLVENGQKKSRFKLEDGLKEWPRLIKTEAETLLSLTGP